jgi:ADP-heptose:LPS heptosyltransferase
MAALQIYDRRERALVAAGDAVLGTLMALARPVRPRTPPQDVRKILLFRLERIGDLLMVLPAIADLRAAFPAAAIDLVVGSWNAQIASAVRGIDRVRQLDPSWLARGSAGASLPAMLREVASWRGEHYDLALNFEPDIRSNLLIAAAGATWTAGYGSGGGGAVLHQALEYQPTAHTTANAKRLVSTVTGATARGTSDRVLDLPHASRQEALALLARVPGPHVAVHVAGGRPVKQWDPDRFATVAQRLVETRGASIVLTGAPGDRELIDRVASSLPRDRVVDASAVSGLLAAAAVLERCELMVTGDTGPMHLAAAVGTPIVAVFGPSDPRRYAPTGPRDRVVRVDLPCAPCNRIRLPPARCIGRTPDCLALVTPDAVFDAAAAILDQCPPGSRDCPA